MYFKSDQAISGEDQESMMWFLLRQILFCAWIIKILIDENKIIKAIHGAVPDGKLPRQRSRVKYDYLSDAA